MKEIGLKKEMVGTVISDKMQKTIVVEAHRRVAHPKYNKVLTLKKKFYAHDEAEKAGMGDVVLIRESRPLSKTKRWTLVEVVRAAKIVEHITPTLAKSRKKAEADAAAAAAAGGGAK